MLRWDEYHHFTGTAICQIVKRRADKIVKPLYGVERVVILDEVYEEGTRELRLNTGESTEFTRE
jgi:hypothetical protein